MPNTMLHSVPRVNSDHCPLKIEASMVVPKSKVFLYENSWKPRKGFMDLVNSWEHWIAVAARQHGKVNWCALGDEDIRFYHATASVRLRSNQIKVIQVNGLPHYSQDGKQCIL